MIYIRGLRIFSKLLVLLISGIYASAESMCEELPFIANGQLVLNGQTPPFNVSDTLAYVCDENFRTDELHPKVSCLLKDGVANWTEGGCKPIVRSCHDPGYIENANRMGHLFTFPHNITYVCNYGYRMVGIATLFCSISGKWQPSSTPYCEAIVCPYLSHPPHGKVLHSQRMPGSVAAYKCDRHYKLVGDSSRNCQEDGTWSGSNPTCEKITCPAPDKLPNGRIIAAKNDTVYHASDIIIFQCNDHSRKTSKCLDSGEWSERPPVCSGPTVVEPTAITTASDSPEDGNLKMNCEDPGTIKYGDRTFMGLKINSTVTYTCDEGYYLRGKSTLLCLENGKWDLDKLPICVKPLSAPTIIGIVFGVIALALMGVGGYFLYRYKMKSIRGYGEKSKALTADATDIEEIAGLEKDKKQIPVTVL